ncbi:ABC transporter permease [Alteribacillus bidgolensis]|uniref:Peptide/nickel transport system permease protein n=1 Tax=Alteribacillus bidgolensis TaxID=930129 RepID=A0A1G8K6W5_9BACI|nr:ABC transporter permease [Alteribacillus bidgolensis]SDI39246.1 peptide/nickel transport system permease protein [Alteribacillus bidgolensis]
MSNYIRRRIIQLLPVMFIIVFIVYCLVYLAGDPVLLMLPENATEEDIARMRAALNLDQPFYIQFFTYISNVIQGDFGDSFRYNQPALGLVLERLPATIELAVASMIVAIGIAIPLGVWSALKRNSITDVFITGGTVLGQAMPNFWLGIMLILIFAVNLQILPVSGTGSYAHLVLPAITLGTGIAAQIARLTRSSMLETLNQDYIRTAKSNGINRFSIVYFHAFRNSLIPVVTITAMQTNALIGGALVTEMIFAWPGLGQLLIQAIHARDMAIVQASVFIIAIIVILMNFIADILYKVLDPRIDYK